MQKKQKINKKKKSQRAYGDFIHIVKYWMYSFIFVPHISNIYDNNDRKEIEVYRLPIWRDVTDIPSFSIISSYCNVIALLALAPVNKAIMHAQKASGCSLK